MTRQTSNRKLQAQIDVLTKYINLVHPDEMNRQMKRELQVIMNQPEDGRGQSWTPERKALMSEKTRQRHAKRRGLLYLYRSNDGVGSGPYTSDEVADQTGLSLDTVEKSITSSHGFVHQGGIGAPTMCYATSKDNMVKLIRSIVDQTGNEEDLIVLGGKVKRF